MHFGLDTYTTNPGCSGWHGSFKAWLVAKCGFVRGGNKIFYYSGNNTSYETWDYNKVRSRGVAVVGQGL